MTDYSLREDANYYYLEPIALGRNYKITKVNPKLTTESETTFDCDVQTNKI